MSTESPNGVVRLDVNDPQDMARLIATGLVWRGDQQTIDLAIDYLREHPEAVNDSVPAAVRTMLQPVTPPEPVTDDELAEAPAADDEATEGQTGAA